MWGTIMYPERLICDTFICVGVWQLSLPIKTFIYANRIYAGEHKATSQAHRKNDYLRRYNSTVKSFYLSYIMRIYLKHGCPETR